MPQLVRFLVRHALIGFVLAFVFVGALLVFDVGGLRRLAAASSYGPLAIAALTFATGLTFASVQMGMAVMLLGHRSDTEM